MRITSARFEFDLSLSLRYVFIRAGRLEVYFAPGERPVISRTS